MSWREILLVEQRVGNQAEGALKNPIQNTTKINYADSADNPQGEATLQSTLKKTRAESNPDAQSETEPTQTPHNTHNDYHDSNFADNADNADNTEAIATLQSALKPTGLESTLGNRLGTSAPSQSTGDISRILAPALLTQSMVLQRKSLRFILRDGGGTILGEAGDTADDLLQTLIEKWHDELLLAIDDGEEVYRQIS